MATADFDCVVLGNEPAGLWLLDALDKQQNLKLGWAREQEPHSDFLMRKLAVPTPVARAFGLSTEPAWNPELIFPGRSFEWNQEKLKSLCPELALIDLWNAPARAAGWQLEKARR